MSANVERDAARRYRRVGALRRRPRACRLQRLRRRCDEHARLHATARSMGFYRADDGTVVLERVDEIVTERRRSPKAPTYSQSPSDAPSHLPAVPAARCRVPGRDYRRRRKGQHRSARCPTSSPTFLCVALCVPRRIRVAEVERVPSADCSEVVIVRPVPESAHPARATDARRSEQSEAVKESE